MKIMFYCRFFYPDNSGYSNAYLNLINAVLDNYDDIHITVITRIPLGEQSEMQRKNLDIVRLKPKINIRKVRYFLNEYFHAKFVSKKFKNENYDLLFIETLDDPIFINLLDNDIYNKTIVRIHATGDTEYTFFDNSIGFKINKYLIKYHLINKLKWFCTTNKFHLNFIKKYYFSDNIIKISEKNFFILPNCVPLIENTDLTVGNKLKIFILGRMDRLGFNQKGFLDFLYALYLLDFNILNKYEITIIGEGEKMDFIVNLARNFPNIRIIKYLHHNETINYLKNSDIVILPSRYEGLSMFALESLATGNVCLFSNTGGLSDLVHENGILFEPQDIHSIAKGLTDIALKSNEEIMNMKRNSLKICQNNYSPPVIAKKFREIVDLVRQTVDFKH